MCWLLLLLVECLFVCLLLFVVAIGVDGGCGLLIVVGAGCCYVLIVDRCCVLCVGACCRFLFCCLLLFCVVL